MQLIQNTRVILQSPVRFFIVCSLLFGILFVFITPPFQGPDEHAHFYRAFQISEGNLVVDQLGDVTGGYLPAALQDVVLYTIAPSQGSTPTPDKKYNLRQPVRARSIKIDSTNNKAIDFAGTTSYTPIPYIPSTAGVLVAKLLGLPPIAMLYMARIANLATWIILMSLAIYLMPRKKWAAVFIGLLPAALFQASMVNADSVTIGLGAVFIAFALQLITQSRKLTNKQIVAFVLVAIGMALSKQVMLILLPLTLLIPAKNSINRKQTYVFKLFSVAIPTILVLAWTYLIRGIAITSTFKNKQDPGAQVNFILHNPHSFINTLWNTYFYSWGDGIVRSFIGVFGWSQVALSDLLIVIGYIGLAAMLLVNAGEKPKWLNRSGKILMVFLLFAYWLGVSAALYIYYSPVGFKIIIGLQGRYFLPVILLAIPLLHGNWLKTSETSYRRIAVFIPLVLLTASLITICAGYYFNNV